VRQLVERRLELLRMEGLGFNQGEITKVLAEKYGLNRRTVQYDFENRVSWQPMFTNCDPRRSLLKTLNRFEFLYREAAFILKTTQNDLAKLGAINSMRETVKLLIDVQGLAGLKDVAGPERLVVEVVDHVREHLQAYDEALEKAVELNVNAEVAAQKLAKTGEGT